MYRLAAELFSPATSSGAAPAPFALPLPRSAGGPLQRLLCEAAGDSSLAVTVQELTSDGWGG